MSLTNFFEANLPYGIKRTANDEWYAFNREYMPLGWNSTDSKLSIYDDDSYKELPIRNSYKGLTDHKIQKIFNEANQIQFDDSGSISIVFFYSDRLNPSKNPKQWSRYLYFIKELSKFEIKISKK